MRIMLHITGDSEDFAKSLRRGTDISGTFFRSFTVFISNKVGIMYINLYVLFNEQRPTTSRTDAWKTDLTSQWTKTASSCWRAAAVAVVAAAVVAAAAAVAGRCDRTR